MEAIIFVGVQATGKSTFFRERFFTTHVRINLDMLRTRNRERILVRACLEAKQPFVLDNTNATLEERARVIGPARDTGFRVVGYYFESKVADALRRNEGRTGDARIPDVGILGTAKRLRLPSEAEGFDRLFYVQLVPPSGFSVQDWKP